MNSLRGDIKDWLYDLADKIFPKQMDKAYDQGIRVGAEYAARLMSFAIHEAGEKADLTKAQKVGFEVSQQAVRDAKKKIAARTGAML